MALSGGLLELGGPLECTASGQRMRMLLCANCLLQALHAC